MGKNTIYAVLAGGAGILGIAYGSYRYFAEPAVPTAVPDRPASAAAAPAPAAPPFPGAGPPAASPGAPPAVNPPLAPRPADLRVPQTVQEAREAAKARRYEEAARRGNLAEVQERDRGREEEKAKREAARKKRREAWERAAKARREYMERRAAGENIPAPKGLFRPNVEPRPTEKK